MMQDEEGPVLEEEFPRLLFNANDYKARIGFGNLDKVRVEA